MRILVIAPTPFFADRGCHVRIFEEVRALQSLGHRITICTYHIGRDLDGLDIRRSMTVPWYSKLTAGPSLHKFYVDLFLLWTVLRACFTGKPDIIHAHLHEGVLIGKIASILFGIPLVADLQGSLTGELVEHKFFKKNGWIYRLFQFMEQLLVRMPDSTLTSSTKMRQWLKENGHDTTRGVHVVIDGVDTARFRPGVAVNGLRHRLGLPERKQIIGFLGLLTEYQGVSVLLDAVPLVVERFPDTHFLIMGYPNVEHYREKANRLGVSDFVSFTGRVAYEEAPAHLALCSVCVSPKLHSSEANGKLLNYMAMGCPIVASDTEINREILGPLGMYAEVGNPRSLAQAISKALSDDIEAAALGRALRMRAKGEFSWHAIGKKIDSAYRDLVGSGVKKGVTSKAL